MHDTMHWELTLSDKLLDELRARHPDEGAVGVVGYSSSQQGLPCAWGPVQQHTLRTQRVKQMRTTGVA